MIEENWTQVTENFLRELYAEIDRLKLENEELRAGWPVSTLLFLKPKVGLEPTTPALRERCSTN